MYLLYREETLQNENGSGLIPLGTVSKDASKADLQALQGAITKKSNNSGENIEAEVWSQYLVEHEKERSKVKTELSIRNQLDF